MKRLFFIFTLAFGFFTHAAADDALIEDVHLRPHLPPALASKCKDCHLKKNQEYISKKDKTKLKHADITSKHGKLINACGNCHDRNNSDLLRYSEDAPATFDNPSPVCKQCHQDRFKDWAKGLHGKRVGGWKTGMEQFNCIDCHDPHSVRFKQMKAEKPPVRPKLGVEKDEAK